MCADGPDFVRRWILILAPSRARQPERSEPLRSTATTSANVGADEGSSSRGRASANRTAATNVAPPRGRRRSLNAIAVRAWGAGGAKLLDVRAAEGSGPCQKQWANPLASESERPSLLHNAARVIRAEVQFPDYAFTRAADRPLH